MQSLRAMGLALLILCATQLSGSCGLPVNGIAVLVHVNNLPPEATRLFVTFKENGTPTKQTMLYIVQQNLTRFAVGITDPAVTSLQVDVQARGDDGCIFGSGTTTVTIPLGASSLETNVDLMADSGCAVDVQVNGEGTVFGPGPTCSGFCSFKVPRGQTAMFSGTPGFASVSGTWADACSGDVTTACSVKPERGVLLQANFVARNCSAAGICAFALPAGARVQSVLAAAFAGAGSGLAAGDNIYSNTAYPNWTTVPHNLGTPLLLGGDVKTYLFAVGAIATSVTTLPNNFQSFVSVSFPGGLGNIQGLSQLGAVVVTDTGKCGRISPINGVTTIDSSPNTQPLYAASVIVGTNAWAVGAQGTILKFNGSSWSAVQPGLTNKNLYGVWTANEAGSDVGFAVGQDGVILQLRGGAWSVMSSGDGKTLRAVWSYTAQKGWAVGDNGVVKVFDGSSWVEKTLPTGTAVPNLISISGEHTTAKVVWMTGIGDTIYGLPLQ